MISKSPNTQKIAELAPNKMNTGSEQPNTRAYCCSGDTLWPSRTRGRC